MPHLRDPVRGRPRLPGGDRDVPRSGYVLPNLTGPSITYRAEPCRSELILRHQTERRRAWRNANPGLTNRWRRKVRETDPERARENNKRAWAKATETPEKRARIQARMAKWRAENPEAVKANQAKSYATAKAKYAADPEYRARCAAANMRCRKKREARRRAEKAALAAAQQTP